MAGVLRFLIVVTVSLALAIGSAFASEEKKKEEKGGGKKGEGGKVSAVVGLPGGPIFYDLPDILVNIEAGKNKSAYLKARIAIQLAKIEDADKITAFMPRILDDCQLYLREMRLDSLKNSKSLDRLRQELLTRVAQAVRPIKVNDVLFREFLVQ